MLYAKVLLYLALWTHKSGSSQATETRSNIALNKRVQQSSTRDNYTAEMAIDGDQDTFSLTMSHFGPSWMVVDLGNNYWVENVLMDVVVHADPYMYILQSDYFSDNLPPSPHKDFITWKSPEIDIGWDSSKRVSGLLAYLIPPPQPCSFIAVWYPGHYSLKVFHLEVLTKIECPPGKYGFNCSRSCHCKHSVPCKRLHGICPAGCKKQYHGDSCSRSYLKSHFPWILAFATLEIIIFLVWYNHGKIHRRILRTRNPCVRKKQIKKKIKY